MRSETTFRSFAPIDFRPRPDLDISYSCSNCSLSGAVRLARDQQWNWRENQALSPRLKNAKLRTPNACVEEIDYRTARGLDKSVLRSLTQESAWVGTHENVFVLGPTEPETF
jgi:hypothetical protein